MANAEPALDGDVLPPHFDQRDGRIPLSAAQERWWFLQQIFPDYAADNVVAAVRLRGELDPAALERTRDEVLSRHLSLRLRFAADASGPYAERDDDAPGPLDLVDLSGAQSDDRDATARGFVVEQARRPFTLALGIAQRWLLLKLAPQEHVLVALCHPLVADRSSMRGVLAEIIEARSGVSAPEPGPADHVDFAAWQRTRLGNGALEPQLDYWRRRLEGAPSAIELPLDRGLPKSRDFRQARIEGELSAAVSRRVEALARARGVAREAILFTALSAVLGRYARQDELVVGYVGSARTPGVSGPGPFHNVLPIRVDLSGAPEAGAVIAQIDRGLEEARRHAELPPESALSGRASDAAGRGGLVQITCAFEEGAESDDGFDPGALDSWTLLHVSFGTRSDSGSQRLSVTFSTEVFDRATVARFIDHLQVIIEGLEAADRSLGELPIVTSAERERLLVEWNASRRAFPREVCVHQLFEQQVARTPDAIAVVADGREWTYRALDRRANQLAHWLVERGVGPEVPVALVLRPSFELIASLFAILKAGGAYVPLDPEAPAERFLHALNASGARLMITETALARGIPDGGPPRILIDAEAQEIDARPDAALPARATPQNLANIIFTSGSTGEPKGVLVPHAGLVNHALGVGSEFALGPSDRVLQFTPILFDAAGEEIYPPLSAGATIVIRGELVPTHEFRDLLESERLTVLSLPPAYLHEWLLELQRQGGTIPKNVRLVILGGEKLLPQTWTLWEACGGAQIPWVNVYGPTEATITSAMCRITSDSRLETASLPIGRPIPNGRIYLLDENQQLVPPGHPGEVYIGGPGVTRGYLGQPELTAAKFVADPFAGGEGERVYRTGDLARHLPDGRLEFLGRVDEQVKIRGFRVEIGEIESVLRAHGGVDAAIVIAREDTPGDKRLVAYVVPRAPEAERDDRALTRELRKAIEQRLPHYMMPSGFVYLGALPLRPNGKVDRKALPPPDDAATAREAEFVAPRNDTEATLCAIWQEALGVARVGVFDNFFELGGHSLVAMQILSRVVEQLGFDLELRHLFETPTVAALAEVIGSSLGDGAVDVNDLSDDQVEEMLRQLARDR